ncbi:MAG: GAF domain-containing protein [Anaerolineae bacterium]|nr:GAF domain-containing protein [Anaerolineae bacterium]
MRGRVSFWLWRVAWGIGVLGWLVVFLVYAHLPADGATGDLESFTPEGFRVQWLFEERPGGLRVGDMIVRAGGHTIDEWLSGAPGGQVWRAQEVVTYEILRDERPMTLQIGLEPVPLRAVLNRWWGQLAASVALVVIGSYVFWKRPNDMAARLLMLFCNSIAVHIWGDAYNFQYAILPRPPLFWSHFCWEYISFIVVYASILNFVSIFPAPHPLMRRFPRFTIFAPYILHALVVALVMMLSPTWPQALRTGSHASWLVALLQALLAIAAAIYSALTVRDPVGRAQIRWILWGASVALVVVIPGYILPLPLIGRPFILHPIVMLLTGIIPAIFGVSILRYRLFDIEIVVNRTVVYGTLTALLGGIYLLLVNLLTWLVQSVLNRHNDTLVVFLATLSIALAFNPLRRQVQVFIDRAFYRKRLDYQKLLPEMTERLATSIVLERLTELLTREIPRRLQIVRAFLLVLDRDGEKFAPTSAGGLQNLSVNHPLVEALRRLGRPLMRLQPPVNLAPDALCWLERHQLELAVPLAIGDELVGLYALGAKLSGETYNGEEIRLLRLLGQQAAVSVQNSRLLRAEREQRRLAEALKKAADVVGSTLNLDQVLDHILEQVARVVNGSAFNIMLLDGGTVHIVRWRGYEPFETAEHAGGLSMRVSEHPALMRAIMDGWPILLPDTAEHPDWVSIPGWEQLRSYVSVPVRIAGQAVGFLNVGGAQPGQFSSADAQRLEAFADHAATAIENARLFQDALRQGDELEIAVARLQELDRLKSEFIQNVSHELRSPLTLIRGYADLLDGGELGELQSEQKKPVEIIARRAQMLGGLVEDIILILLAETRTLEREPVTLDELAVAAVEDFQDAAEKAGLELKTEIAPGVPAVSGTTLHLRRVLDNLINNALKFTPAGGSISVSVQSNATHVILQVKDTGIGIAPDQQKRIFERFYQVDGSTRRQYGGVGLGLALVKEIVEAHGGVVSVESQENEGSTFTVTLPALEDSDRALDGVAS